MSGKIEHKTTLKIVFIFLCIIIVSGSIFGIYAGSFLTITEGVGFTALIVVSSLLLFTAVYGVFFLYFRKRIPIIDQIGKSTKILLIWLIVAIGTGGSAVGIYFNLPKVVKKMIGEIIVLCVLAILTAICLYSIFFLILGVIQKKVKVTETKNTTEDETIIKEKQ